jgi:macrolide-specific efflux system membrane fusion protein
MISPEAKELEVPRTIEKNRAASASPAGSKATPGPTVRTLSRAWLLLPIAVVAVAAVFLLLPPRVQVTKLATMSIRDEAVGVGFVQAKVPISASAKINGIIRKVYVDQGDPVKRRQILAQLENDDYRSQIMQAESLMQATEAALSSARAQLLATEARAEAGRSAVARSRAGLNLCEDQFRPGKGTL